MRISDWSSDVCSSDLHVRIDVFTDKRGSKSIVFYSRVVKTPVCTGDGIGHTIDFRGPASATQNPIAIAINRGIVVTSLGICRHAIERFVNAPLDSEGVSTQLVAVNIHRTTNPGIHPLPDIAAAVETNRSSIDWKSTRT